MARLFYIIGASGCGKDSLLRAARQRLQGHSVLFAHRYITRPRHPEDGEDHVPLSATEFAAMRAAGLFRFHWQSHGFDYGVGREVERWLAAGLDVVVNGSRAYLAAARRRCPTLRPVLVRADPRVVAARLASRGRETPEQMAHRLERGSRLDAALGQELAPLPVIDNSGHLQDAVAALLTLLQTPQPH